MSNSPVPALQQAFNNAQAAFSQSTATCYQLQRALEVIPENDRELREHTSRLLEKTRQSNKSFEELQFELSKLVHLALLGRKKDSGL